MRTIKTYAAPLDITKKEIALCFEQSSDVHTVIMALFLGTKTAADNWGITHQLLVLLDQLQSAKKKIVLLLFGNPYALRNFGGQEAILVAYDESIEAQFAAAQTLCGEHAPAGRLPITASTFFHEGKKLSW